MIEVTAEMLATMPPLVSVRAWLADTDRYLTDAQMTAVANLVQTGLRARDELRSPNSPYPHDVLRAHVKNQERIEDVITRVWEKAIYKAAHTVIAQRALRKDDVFDDIAAACAESLIRHLRTFDPSLGSFAPYAIRHLRNASELAANAVNPIKIPERLALDARQILGVARRLENRTGERPTDAEIADAAGYPVESVTRTFAIPRVTTSLDAPIGDGTNTIGETFAAEPTTPVPEWVTEYTARLANRMALATTVKAQRVYARTLTELHRLLDGDGSVNAASLQRLGHPSLGAKILLEQVLRHYYDDCDENE